MKIEWRMKIAKIKPLHRLARILMYNSGWFFYKKIYKNRKYRTLFSTLKDSKHGKRCFIIGNGPSLRSEDLDKLKDEDCFAANGIFYIFQNTAWRPTYYLVMDRYFDAMPETIRDLESDIVFLGDYYWRFNKVLRDDAVCLHESIPFNQKHYPVSNDISRKVVVAHTVSFAAMQIAAYLGYKEIYLLGFDHNYGIEIDDNGKLTSTSESVSHFYTDDHPKEIVANVIGMTRAYKSFKEYANRHGIVVKNVTRGGKLEVFPRVDFDSIFDNKEN